MKSEGAWGWGNERGYDRRVRVKEGVQMIVMRRVSERGETR